MKKISYLFALALGMLLSVNTFAQKSVVSYNTATGKQMIDEKTVAITFQLNNVPNETVKQKFESAFKNSNLGVMNVKSTLQSGGNASYTVTMPKQRHLATLQKMFLTSGIETVSIDGTSVETQKLVEYAQANKAKK